jgi:glycosyltransferase involved in cell wall biosynthesis
MRIAYLVEVDITNESGIARKINGQTKHWQALNHQVKVFSVPSLNKNKESKSSVLEVESEIFIHSISRKFKGQVKNYLNKILSSGTLHNSLIKFSPDIIYYRQGIWFPGFDKILNLPYPIVIEANTNDLEEIKLEGKIRQLVYKYGRKKIINKASGFIGVTDEITKLYTPSVQSSVTITNGYQFDGNLCVKPTQHNKRPQLVFVGSPGCAWHGVDKIITLARSTPDFDYNIIGYTSHMFAQESLPNNICFHGFLSINDLIELYSQSDIAIGSLAFHRAGLNEGCPLKVREYCAFGLPVILGYIDTDFDGQNFVCNIGNYEDNITTKIGEIMQFVSSWHGKRVQKQIVESLVSFEVKEKKRLAYFEEISYAFKGKTK